MYYYKVSLADSTASLADPLMKTHLYNIILYINAHYIDYTILLTSTCIAWIKVSLADSMVSLADPLMKTLLYNIILYRYTHYNSCTI
jgi:hypothetical protein